MLDKHGLTEDEFIAAYDAGKYPHPSLTADLALIADGELLLIKRGGHPCMGKWAMPGGFVEPNETVEAAAARELFEETGVAGVEPTLLGVFSRPGRDRRGWVVTTLFGAITDKKPTAHAADDARDARWFKVGSERCGELLHITLRADELTLDLEVEARERVTRFGKDWQLTM